MCHSNLSGATEVSLPVGSNPKTVSKPLIPGVRPIVWGGVALGVPLVLVMAGVGLYRINNPVRPPSYLEGNTPWQPRIVIREPQRSRRAALPEVVTVTALEQELVMAVSKGDYNRASQLLEQGVRVMATSKSGIPAFVIAANRGNIPLVQLFLDKGCDVNLQMPDLPALGKKNIRWSALHFVAAKGDEDVLKLLLAKGANVHLQAADGSTALNNAATMGRTGAARLLIEAGADVNHKTRDGLNPLLIAADRGHTECVQLLLEKGADVNIKGSFGDSALYHAEQGGHQQIVQMLRDAGAR
jgi:ankyrin repeat protein